MIVVGLVVVAAAVVVTAGRMLSAISSPETNREQQQVSAAASGLNLRLLVWLDGRAPAQTRLLRAKCCSTNNNNIQGETYDYHTLEHTGMGARVLTAQQVLNQKRSANSHLIRATIASACKALHANLAWTYRCRCIVVAATWPFVVSPTWLIATGKLYHYQGFTVLDHYCWREPKEPKTR